MAITTGRTAWGQAAPNFSNFLPVYWDALLAENLFPNLTLYGYGTKRQIPRNFGRTIKIPRFKKRPGVVTSFDSTSEGNFVLGVKGTCSAMSEFVSGSLQQFVGVYRHSDIVVMTALSDVVNLSVRDIARSLAARMDTHIRTQISGTGARVWSDPGGLSSATHSDDVIRSTDFLKATAILDANNNPRPAGGCYPAVIHPIQQFSLQRQLTGNAWVEVNKYKGSEEPENLYRAELGRLFGCVISTSTNIQMFNVHGYPDATGASTGSAVAGLGLSSGATGAQAFVFAPEAYYVTEISDMTAKTFIKGLGSGGTFDPVNTVATVGAKVFFTAIPATFQDTNAAVNSEKRMVRIISGQLSI